MESRGLTELVIGTGGRSAYRFTRTDPRVLAGFDAGPQAVGALRLELNPAGAAFRYVSVTGGTLDSGSVPCREAPTDTLPPTIPTGLGGVPTGPTRVVSTWTASTDDTGVTGYDVFRDGQLLMSVGPVTTYSDLTTVPGTTYRYEVRARDAANNLSAFGAPAMVTTPSGSSSVLRMGSSLGRYQAGR